MHTEKGNRFNSYMNWIVSNKVIIIGLLELILVFQINISRAQNKIELKLKKLEIKNPVIDSFDSSLLLIQIPQAKIRLDDKKIEIRQENGAVQQISTSEIETKIGKDSLQKSIENLNTNDQEVQVNYCIYDNSLLLVRLFLKSKETESRTAVKSLIINNKADIFNFPYKNLTYLKSFSDGNFAAINENETDTIYFFNNKGELINKNVLPLWSNLQLDNESSLLKAYNIHGDIRAYTSQGKTILNNSIKNTINSDLFDFFLSPDSTDIYISTFLSKELIRYSLIDEKIIWRVGFERTEKCIINLKAGMICTDSFTDLLFNNDQQSVKKHTLSIIMIDSGNILSSLDNNELLTYKNNTVISKEGERYYEYIIE